MIKALIELLNSSDYYGVSERVDIAKGKYKMPIGWKDSFNKIKRHSKREREPITWKIVWNKIKDKWLIRR
jgi:hypothetical protein